MRNSRWSMWSNPANGIAGRVRIAETFFLPNNLTIEAELKNVSQRSIPLFDFQDKSLEWPASASYLRGMLIGVNDNEPCIYHLLSLNIIRIIKLSPGESYTFLQTDIPSSFKTIRMVYDTTVVEKYWPLDYWKGRIEFPALQR